MMHKDKLQRYYKYCPIEEQDTIHTDEWFLINEETSHEELAPFCHDCETFH